MLYFVKYLMLAKWCMNCILLYMPFIVIQFDNFWDQELWYLGMCTLCEVTAHISHLPTCRSEEVIFEAAAKRCLLSLSVIVQNKVNISIGGLKLTPSRVKNHISLKAKATKPEKWGLSAHSHTKADEGEMTDDDSASHQTVGPQSKEASGWLLNQNILKHQQGTWLDKIEVPISMLLYFLIGVKKARHEMSKRRSIRKGAKISVT